MCILCACWPATHMLLLHCTRLHAAAHCLSVHPSSLIRSCPPQPHTHDFCGIGGSSEPVDRCYSGCRGGGQGLPRCTSTSPFFSGGAGTIMSCADRVFACLFVCLYGWGVLMLNSPRQLQRCVGSELLH